VLTGTPEAPNANELLGLDRAEAKAREIAAAIDTFVTGPMSEFRAAVTKSGLGLLAPSSGGDKPNDKQDDKK